jgi:hypothetical protein
MELNTLCGTECSDEDAKESLRFIIIKNVPVLDLTERLGACFFFNRIKDNQLNFSSNMYSYFSLCCSYDYSDTFYVFLVSWEKKKGL